MPTLFCFKKTGPCESILIAMATIKNSGAKIIKPKSERIISINLFIFK